MCISKTTCICKSIKAVLCCRQAKQTLACQHQHHHCTESLCCFDNLASVVLQQVYMESIPAGHAKKVLLAKLQRNFGTLAGLFVAHGKDPSSSLYEHTKKEAGKYEGDLCCATLGSKVKAQQECKTSKECSQACKKWKGQDQRLTQLVTELGLLLGCHIALQWNQIKCCTTHVWC